MPTTASHDQNDQRRSAPFDRVGLRPVVSPVCEGSGLALLLRRRRRFQWLFPSQFDEMLDSPHVATSCIVEGLSENGQVVEQTLNSARQFDGGRHLLTKHARLLALRRIGLLKAGDNLSVDRSIVARCRGFNPGLEFGRNPQTEMWIILCHAAMCVIFRLTAMTHCALTLMTHCASKEEK